VQYFIVTCFCFREQVCKQFHPILPTETVPNSNGSSSVAPLLQSQHLGGQSLNLVQPNVTQQISRQVITNNPAPTQTSNLNPVQAPVGVPTLTRCVTAPAVAPVSQEPVVLPSWASNTANAVAARLNPALPFDIEGRYWVKPAFLKVLRLVEGVNQSQLVFPYREVTNILSKYIMVNKDRFFDLRNIRIALVENDPLGEAFGVKAFARSQVTSLLRAQLRLYVESSQPVPIEDDSKESDEKLTMAKRKRSSGTFYSFKKSFLISI
jgi:hypothetical protein